MGQLNGQKIRQISIPYAVPNLGSSLKLATVHAPIGEWVGPSFGLGYLMLLANGRVKTDLMFASLIILALVAMLLHALMSYCR